MNTNQKLSFLEYTLQTLPPAQLWIGSHSMLMEQVNVFLQKILCKNQSCNTCITCMQIREKQHHGIMWLHPDKNYTLDQLEDLFTTLTFQLQPDELFFFIIQKADFLTPVCANKLLKSIEEPPRGYHFILLAEYTDKILPTIRSRCAEYHLTNEQPAPNTHPLYECFTKKIPSIDEFSKILDVTSINERESIEQLDMIMYFWITKINSRETSNSSIIISIINTLKKTHQRSPMPGSSIIFWRNLYLQLYKDLNLYFK